MKISELIKSEGYKNSTVRICEFLGFLIQTNSKELNSSLFKKLIVLFRFLESALIMETQLGGYAK